MTRDDQLHANVVEELRAEPAVRRSRLHVRARDGIVTVCGQVGTFTERCSIDGAMSRVVGIEALDMQVSVARSAICRPVIPE